MNWQAAKVSNTRQLNQHGVVASSASSECHTSLWSWYFFKSCSVSFRSSSVVAAPHTLKNLSLALNTTGGLSICSIVYDNSLISSSHGMSSSSSGSCPGTLSDCNEHKPISKGSLENSTSKVQCHVYLHTPGKLLWECNFLFVVVGTLGTKYTLLLNTV